MGATLSWAPAEAAPTALSVPAMPVGAQLNWLLSITQLPLSTTEITTHFDTAFLAQASPAELNSALAGLSANGPPTLLGLSNLTPTSLTASVAFGTVSFNATLSVDSSGLIDELLFTLVSETTATSWAQVDEKLAAIAPEVSFLAAEVNTNGTCSTIHSVSADTPRPLGSMFKLFVLGALANAVHAHKITWNEKVTVTASVKAGGSGTLQSVPDGTRLTVQQVALKMISISDNTAADLLLNLVGRAAVESQVRKWTAHPALDIPFLTVNELFALHLYDFPTLANRYLGLKPSKRAAFLASSVDAVPAAAEVSTTSPRDITSIEWFASPDDLCRAFSGLTALSKEAGLEPINTILSTNNGGIGLSSKTWPVIWFKGGSEPGVQTLGYIARDMRGHSFVVVALTENPAQPESASSTNELLAVVKSAFDLLH
jgi:beta-lactamase class A